MNKKTIVLLASIAENGCRTCSASCNNNGAVGFVIESDCGDDE